MKRIFIAFFAFIFSINLSAQQEEFYTNFSNNILNINPSYAGSRDGLSISNFYRNYWLGFKGSPFIYNKNVHSPIYKDILGVGLSFSYSRIGPTSSIDLYGSFSSTFKLSKEKKHDFRMGINGGFKYIQNTLLQLGVTDDQDPEFYQNVSEKILPNVGFGFIYEQTNFYIGYSIPKLIENFYDDKDGNLLTKQRRYHAFIAGFLVPFDNSNKVVFRPSILSVMNESLLIDQKFLLNFEFLERFWLGAGVMFGNNSRAKLNFLTGIRIGKIIEMGYSFDYNIRNQSFKYNGGSHEVFLKWDIIYKPKENIDNPRWF